MSNSVKVVPNALSSYAQDTLEKIVTDFKFPWYYRPTTIDIDPRINKHQFVHHVYDGVGKDYNYENVMRFFSFLPDHLPSAFRRHRPAKLQPLSCQAAQLLEQTSDVKDRELTRLIIEETDRSCALVDRMEMFTDNPRLERKAVNIHEVLNHVVRLAQNGFGRAVRFIEAYDPSLPPAFGDRDQLIQIFLNLG